MREDRLFADLCRAVPKPKAREAFKNTWILWTTWRLVDKIVSARQDPARDQTLILRLGRAINASLKGDQRRRAEEAGEEVKMIIVLDPSLHWEAWNRMEGWYWSAVDCAPPPSWVTLERITADRVELYRYVSPPGENITSRWRTRYLRRTRSNGQ